jgi:hypothetical protein
MRQLMYVSTAAMLPAAELEAILAAAQRNNDRDGLTGFLLYNGRNFLQYLEGEEPVLRARIERIKADPRHDGLVILHDVAAKDRHFPDWGMQHVALLPDYAERRDQVRAQLGDDRLHGIVRQLVESFALLN